MSQQAMRLAPPHARQGVRTRPSRAYGRHTDGTRQRRCLRGDGPTLSGSRPFDEAASSHGYVNCLKMSILRVHAIAKSSQLELRRNSKNGRIALSDGSSVSEGLRNGGRVALLDRRTTHKTRRGNQRRGVPFPGAVSSLFMRQSTHAKPWRNGNPRHQRIRG